MAIATDVSSSAVPLNRPLYLFYIAGFLVVGGGFVLLTSDADLRLAPERGAASIVSQTILAFFYCGGVLLLIANPEAARVCRRAWPILLLPAIALLSAIWSPEPLLSLRRAVAFLGTILFGLSLGAAYSMRDLVVLITRSLSLACLFSCAIVLVNPRHGVHQYGDAIGAVHSGLWRGIFGHRNTLGLWAGACTGVLIGFGGYSFAKILTRIAVLIIALACLIGANSGTGYVISAVLVVLSASLLLFNQQPVHRRGLLLLIAALGMIIALLLRDDIETWSLYLLGKSSDLTGRTLLWYYVFHSMEKTPALLGGGYFVGFFSLDTEISRIMQTRFGSAHNGYIETFVYLGYTGLTVCIAVIGWLVYCAIRYMLNCAQREPYMAAFPISVLLVVIVHNFVESTIILPNNLNTLLASIMAGMFAIAGTNRIGAVGEVGTA
jgi:exopolysaccharide production protein ExoQ